jgi:hypothetical protein
MSLYTELKDAGCQIDSHYSDLYVLSTPESRAIIARHGGRCSPSAFRSQIDGKVWIDLPFCFEPYWEAVARKAALVTP